MPIATICCSPPLINPERCRRRSFRRQNKNLLEGRIVGAQTRDPQARSTVRLGTHCATEAPGNSETYVDVNKIRSNERFAEVHGSRYGLHAADQAFQEGRFAGTVVAENANATAPAYGNETLHTATRALYDATGL
jgi:hypothetical protein